MHGHQMNVAPIPTSKRADKLVILCTVSKALANHHTLLHVGVDAAFSKTSLQNPILKRVDMRRVYTAVQSAFQIRCPCSPQKLSAFHKSAANRAIRAMILGQTCLRSC